MKTIVVTGGAGFIGSHLCERLVADGHKVISLDNYFTGSRDNHVAGVEYREGHTKDIDSIISEEPDIIYHLGEYSRVAKSIDEPDVVWDLNIDGTLGVLEFWRRLNTKKECKLVYAGSSTKQAGVRSDGVEGRNLSPYTWAKASNSDLVIGYGQWYKLPYAITYFYNVYGAGERGTVESMGTFIEICRQKYLMHQPVQIRGEGTQTRAFTHVDDTVEGIVLAGEKGQGDEYGISAKEVFSLLEVAQLFELKVELLPPTASTRSTGSTDTSKLAALGWQQKHTLPEYIEHIKKSV